MQSVYEIQPVGLGRVCCLGGLANHGPWTSRAPGLGVLARGNVLGNDAPWLFPFHLRS